MLALVCMLPVLSSAQDHRFDPPWNPPAPDGQHFTVPGVDNVPDLYGDINDPDLVVFFGGNEFMVMDELLAAFRKANPSCRKIFVETLPPGILAKQIEQGSLTVGNMRIDLKPDVYIAGKSAIEQRAQWFSRTAAYAGNRLAIMVAKGNPKGVRGLADLGRKDIRVSMPNPEWEGIGKRIEEAYTKAGGENLRNRIMQEKVNDNTTFLTQIHHRQTPMRILYGQSDAGPVWYTEVYYQQMIGHPVELITIPDKDNLESVSMAGLMKQAPHLGAGRDFVDFLTSDAVKAIYKKYGFTIP